jgi:insulysin
MVESTTQHIDDINKSKSDKRLYKLLTLPNKLRCLLIQDDEADKSAASLDVNVGCALDPKEFFGTAHFLEHMLFMGTEKYPNENEYSDFIKNQGGYNNAFTSLSDTNYHFEVSNDGFEKALDMFAQFFISPLLGDSQAEREMNAVDSEFNMSQQSDAWRKFMMLQHISHPDSALCRFNCGNLKSLKKDGIRQNLLDFHKKWYSANIMNLVVAGKHSIQQLESWVVEKFSAVPNKDLELPDYSKPVHPFPSEKLGVITKFQPI